MFKESFPKIIIRTPNWLGDLVISTGFIKAVLDKFPKSKVDLIVKEEFEELPLIHRGKIILFDPKKNSAGDFGKKLRNENYDIFFVLPPSFSSAWMAYRSRTPKRIGYAGQFRNIFLSYAKKNENERRSEHILKDYLNLLSTKIPIEKYMPYIKTTDEWIEKKINSLENKIPNSYFVLSPGANYGPSKRWPIEYFRELALKIYKFFDSSIIILGTSQDKKVAEGISNGMDFIHNYCGKTSLSELIAILSKTKLLVSNDSGSMHLMSALGKPQIAIFGSTSPKWTSPLNPYSKVIKIDLACSPCFSKTCRYNHYECMTKITPELVFLNIQKVLKEKD